MKTEISRCLFAAAVIAAVFPAFAGTAAARKAIDAGISARIKGGANYRDVVEFLEGRLADVDVKTNAALRVHIDRKILSYCAMPSWVNFRRWDKKWSDAHVPGVCLREIEAADCPVGDKLHFLHVLSRHQAGEKDYASSIATARKAFSLGKLKPGESFRAHCQLADAYRWADRYEDAREEYRKAAAFNAIGAARLLAGLASDYGNEADLAAAWSAISDPYPRLIWFRDRARAKAAADAFAYLLDEKNPMRNRRDILLGYFATEKSPRGDRAREIARKMDFSKYVDWRVRGEFLDVYRYGDWEFFVTLAESFPGLAWFEDEAWHRGYLFSLIASGRGDEVAAKADAFLARDAAKAKPSVTPVSRVRFEMLKALAAGRDLVAVAKGANLEVREYAKALQAAARWCLNLRRNAECERYSSAYRALFKEDPERRYGVKFFDRPVSSVAAWRGIVGGLEKTYVDVRMCGELDSLETDVATGRMEIEKTALDSKDARMEVTAFCDVEGLKIVMRVADANARAVENGFAGGIGTECYFAPGRGEPYICFSSSPKNGLGFVFYTAYSSADYRRVEFDDGKSPFALKQETAFTDGDYVFMVKFPWRAFYRNLPGHGTEWRFECLADGYSWGGSQGVHESSSWGSLVFGLEPEQAAAIRRRLVYDTYKTWNGAGHGKLATFDRWRDPVVGDPEFYESSLRPLEVVLKEQSARVKPEMTDDEVNEIYEKGAKIWIGLDHEIDALRRAWLLEKFIR